MRLSHRASPSPSADAQHAPGLNRGHRSLKRTGGALFIVLLVALMVYPTAFGTQQQDGPRRKFRSGDDVVVPAGETIAHDLYVSGGRIRIDGRIEGDLIAAGGDVSIQGPVTGDVLAAGGSITVNGAVDGDVRVAGGTVTIGGQVREDVLASAGTLSVSSAARIGGDLVFGAGTANVGGAIAGAVLGSSGRYSFTGTAAGGEEVTLQQRSEPSAADRILGHVRRYISIVLVGALLLWALPRLLPGAARSLHDNPLPSVGMGLVGVAAFIAMWLIILIAIIGLGILLGALRFGGLLAASILGLVLGGGLMTYLVVLVALFLAQAVVGLALGRLILGRGKAVPSSGSIAALALGALIVVALTALPAVGSLLGFIVFIVGLGAIVLTAMSGRERRPRADA